MKTLTTIVLLFSVTLISGCGSDIGAGKVTGTVTFNGQPLAKTMIVFHPANGGATAMSSTDADGHYELSYADGKKGTPVGTYRITAAVSSPSPDVPPPVSIPDKYHDPQTSGIEVQVKKGKNVIDIELKTE